MECNSDVFINMVNSNAEKRRILDESKRKSMIDNKVSYTKKRKKIRPEFKFRTAALLLVLGIGVSAINLVGNDFSENRAIYTEAHNNADFIASETYRVNNNQDFAYDNLGIAKHVTKYSGDRDINAVIYSCYYNYSYDVLKQMDELFSNMYSLIDGHEEQYSKEIVDACNYASFDEYLDALNFTSLGEYKEKMKDLLLAYSKNDSESEEVKIILDEINNQGIDYGGR